MAYAFPMYLQIKIGLQIQVIHGKAHPWSSSSLYYKRKGSFKMFKSLSLTTVNREGCGEDGIS